MAVVGFRVGAADEAEFHLVGFGENGLRGPAGEFTAVVFHFRGDDGSALGDELGAPIKGTTGALGFVVKFVESLDEEVLVFAGDVVFDYSIEFSSDDQMEGLFIFLEGQVEATIFIGFRGERLGFFGGVVERVGVREFHF